MSTIAIKKPKLALIVPCFNESEVLNFAHEKLQKLLDRLQNNNELSEKSFLLFIDDGSTDETWEIIKSICYGSGGLHKGLRLSKNFGHQKALLAGLTKVNGLCDCAISIDADLQQDEGAVSKFLDGYKAGAEIIFGVRKDRVTDGLFKKVTASLFYRFMQWMGVDLIPNHADYRLLSAKALDILAKHREANVFLRGMFTTFGLKTQTVLFDVKERHAGQSKYTLKKMLRLAVDGVTSSSIVPLRIATIIGILVFCWSVIMSILIVYESVVLKITVPGWASTVIPIYFIGGIQLLSIGLLGEYVGKIYLEVKMRPRYIIEEEV